MPVIELRHLRKEYDGTPVIEDLSLEMAEAEFTVLVGPSGCGKSTTLRMIAGLEDVTGGEILIDGRDVACLDPKERDLAMVFQDYALYPHMNVARNMSFALRLARTPRAEIDRKVREVAEILGLTNYLDRRPAELSGGQRQRVAMGRALVRDASTFLFDEPLSNLDAKLRGQMRGELALMRRRVDKNMIYVTHDQVEAMTLGDRIVVMRAGRIMQAGTPEALFRAPANMFVAGFIGSPPMNFLPGEIAMGDAGASVRGEGFSVPLPPDRARRLGGSSGRRVIVGVRPSGFALSDAPGALRAISEYVGAQSVLTADLGGQRVLVEIATPAPIHVGEVIGAEIDPEQMHLFAAVLDAVWGTDRARRLGGSSGRRADGAGARKTRHRAARALGRAGRAAPGGRHQRVRGRAVGADRRSRGAACPGGDRHPRPDPRGRGDRRRDRPRADAPLRPGERGRALEPRAAARPPKGGRTR